MVAMRTSNKEGLAHFQIFKLFPLLPAIYPAISAGGVGGYQILFNQLFCFLNVAF